jgi:cell division protein FtsI/penicillin-binding protein 2
MARGYNRNERVGAFGVEQSMEEYLHGTWGKQEWEIDASGQHRAPPRLDRRRSPAWTSS